MQRISISTSSHRFQHMLAVVGCPAGSPPGQRRAAKGSRARRCWAFLTCLCFVCGLSGCDRTEQALHNSTTSESTDATRSVATTLSARSILDQCFAAYRQLDRYEDAGFVRLLYTLDGQAMEDRAPLSVAVDRTDGLDYAQVGIRAYSVEAGPDGERWRLKLNEKSTVAATVAGQVISRPLPTSLDFAWLLDDPLVAQSLSAGLAGFPPQIELLLSEQPFAGLINDAATLSLKKPQTVDGHVCHLVSIRRAAAEYILWIDQQTMLVRRLLIPNSNLSPEMLADRRVQDVQLTIELPKLNTKSEIAWSRFTPQVQPDDLLVTHFVPGPMRIDVEGLNQRIPAFELRGADERIAFDSASRQRQGKILVMVWLANHPACRVAAEQLSQVAVELREHNPELAAQVQFVSVWAEPDPPNELTFAQLPSSWNMPGQFAIDEQAMGRDVFRISEAPTVVVVDAENRLQLREARANPILDRILPDLLHRLAAGENVAEAVVQQAEIERLRFSADLNYALTSDSQTREIRLPEAYPPLAFRLTELEHTPGGSAATCVDSRLTVWRLLHDGTLQQQSSRGELLGEFDTRWQLESGQSIKLEISPESRYLACGVLYRSQLEIYDTRTQRNRTVPIPADGRVVDFRWLAIRGSETPRLAVVTDEQHTVLLDPSNHEQLSGTCPSEPLAIVAARNADSPVQGYVVLANGRLEPLQLANDSAVVNRNPAERANDGTSLAKPQAVNNGRVGFVPSAGPWHSWSAPTTLTLARGELAVDEPALYLLDPTWAHQWHYRMPTDVADQWTLVAAGKDPASGQPVWAVTEDRRTLHVLRTDGALSDHFRVADPISGIALLPAGDQLLLRIEHDSGSKVYSLAW